MPRELSEAPEALASTFGLLRGLGSVPPARSQLRVLDCYSRAKSLVNSGALHGVSEWLNPEVVLLRVVMACNHFLATV